MSNGERPLGVTIIGILYLILGIFSLIGGIGVIGAGSLVGLGGLGAIGAAPLFVVGIIDLLIGWGCFKGWGWVWTLAVIFGIFNILMAFYNWWVAGATMGGLFSTLVGIIIPVIILWYLFKDNVKRWFGKT